MSTSPWAIVRRKPSIETLLGVSLALGIANQRVDAIHAAILSASIAPEQVLTDAEMRECANGCFRPNGELENYKFARAIEAAILAKLAAAPAQQPNGKGGE